MKMNKRQIVGVILTMSLISFVFIMTVLRWISWLKPVRYYVKLLILPLHPEISFLCFVGALTIILIIVFLAFVVAYLILEFMNWLCDLNLNLDSDHPVHRVFMIILILFSSIIGLCTGRIMP